MLFCAYLDVTTAEGGIVCDVQESISEVRDSMKLKEKGRCIITEDAVQNISIKMNLSVNERQTAFLYLCHKQGMPVKSIGVYYELHPNYHYQWEEDPLQDQYIIKWKPK